MDVYYLFSQRQLFSVPTVSVSVLQPGTVGTVSGSVKATHVTADIEVTDCTCNCSMQVEKVFSSGETFMWPHMAGLSNSWSYDLVCLKCSVNML